MKRSNTVLAVALTAAMAHASCGSEDPSRLGRPPVVRSYQPSSRTLTGSVGDTLRFSIQSFDPDSDPLTTSYRLGDLWVTDSPTWDFVIVDTGVVDVRGQVSDGANTSYIDWRVHMIWPANLAPVIAATLPIEPSPRLVIGNRIDFAVVAIDPERTPLGYTFSVNDSLIATERQFSYEATSLGQKRVHVIVTDGENAVEHDWELKVTTVPDTIPPAPVVITLAETGVEPGEVTLEWTAVGRDGMFGLPSLYQVRTSPVPMSTEQDWARGSERPNVPAPGIPGAKMRMVVGGLLPARPVYVAVRASDDFGNVSAIQTPVHVVTRGMRFGGRVIDTVTGQGIPEGMVTFGNYQVSAGSDGEFEFVEQGYGSGNITAFDESGDEVGGYFDYSKSYSVAHLDVVNMYLLPNLALETTHYADFFALFRAMTDNGGMPYPADQRRRDLPIALYARPFASGGLDYAATIHDVAAEFNAILGTTVFVPANEPLPAARVETTYSGSLQRDRHGILEWTIDWYPLVSLIEFRNVYNPSNVDAFKITIRHELGHALGLQHSTDDRHIMVGGSEAPSAPGFAPEEVAVLRSHYTIPRGWNNRLYRRD
jgi:hypothetical protein